MGLFSSKYVTRVGTVASRVIEDAKLPSAVKVGITKALFSGDQLVENILEEVVAGIGVRAGSMYRYGRDTYSYGLPSGTLLSSSDGASTVAALLKTLYGAGTTVSYHHFGPLNNLHFGWKKLCEQFAYDSATNQIGSLSIEKGVPVYLKDMVVVVAEATLAELDNGSLSQWGTGPNEGYTPERDVIGTSIRTPTPFMVSATGAGDHLEVSYVWQTSTAVLVEGVSVTRKVINQGSFNIPVTGYDEAADYFQVKYTVNGKDGYWLYKLGAGTYPTVDSVFTTQSSSQGTYFPIGYFRYGKQSMAKTPTSTEFIQSKKLMGYLGMNFLQVAEAIDKNPDIASVESALLMMAVPANTANPIEQKYLYAFFERIYATAGSSSYGVTGHDAVSLALGMFGVAARSKISLVIEDKRFKTALSCAAVTKTRKVGVLGPVGFYSSGWEAKTVTTNGGGPDLTSFVDHYYYRHQISGTLYDEIQVVDLKMSYYVFGSYTSVGDDLDAITLIPLDFAITDAYPTGEKEQLYARSLHYIFNSKTVTEVKWYQQSWFQIFITIVAIAIALIDGGFTLEGVLAAIAAASAYDIFAYLVVKALVYFALREAFKLFVKIVGIKLALILSIVALLAGVTVGIENGSFAGSPWAKDLLMLSTGLSQGVQSSLKDAMAGIVDESNMFAKMVETKEAALDTANKLLDGNNNMAPFFVFGEKPDDFYNRTVHSGNIGILGLDMISSYVETALTLPQLSETL